MTRAHARMPLLKDTSGASIVIALVFFLICGVVGSVVVTAASVQAKSVQTHQDLQQDEYTMQSAAELVAQQLGGESGSSGKSVVIGVSYHGEDPVADVSQVKSTLGKGIWIKDRTEMIIGQSLYIIGRSDSDRVVITVPDRSEVLPSVFGMITIDADLNMTVELSLDKALSSSSPYNMTVFIQCTPTYNASGKLTAFSYGDNTVIEKTSGGGS